MWINLYFTLAVAPVPARIVRADPELAPIHATRHDRGLGVTRGSPTCLAACPCCESKVIGEPGAYEICEVCNWEDDPTQSADPTYAGGANRMSLVQARISRNGG